MSFGGIFQHVFKKFGVLNACLQTNNANIIDANICLLLSHAY